jgi:hypothetical protein
MVTVENQAMIYAHRRKDEADVSEVATAEGLPQLKPVGREAEAGHSAAIISRRQGTAGRLPGGATDKSPSTRTCDAGVLPD